MSSNDDSYLRNLYFYDNRKCRHHQTKSNSPNEADDLVQLLRCARDQLQVRLIESLVIRTSAFTMRAMSCRYMSGE